MVEAPCIGGQIKKEVPTAQRQGTMSKVATRGGIMSGRAYGTKKVTDANRQPKQG